MASGRGEILHRQRREDVTERGSPAQAAAGARRVLGFWYGLMAAGGLGFGLLGERRPFGQDVLAHPLIVFFVVAGVGLIVLRATLKRPVPDVIPERPLIAGCVLGAAAYLAGNFLATHL
jgi:hypothetical protein